MGGLRLDVTAMVESGLVAAAALADARRLAVARVRRADGGRRASCSPGCRSTATGPDVLGAVSCSRASSNLLVVAVLAPLLGMLLRRRRRDLPL